MNESSFYSVRMHASREGGHVSGAERIVREHGIREVVSLFLARAWAKGILPDQVRISIDDLGQERLPSAAALDLATVAETDYHKCRSGARQVLLHAGVSADAVDRAMSDISRGAAPLGRNMRGAMLIDMHSGERLEPDRSRGIRASRFDWSEHAVADLEKRLTSQGLAHVRTREALALATKIAHGPLVAAELCWSDDPDYTAGYAASLKTGYVRFPMLKEPGSRFGGRAIFLRDNAHIDELISYLEGQPLLIEAPTCCLSISSLQHYLNNRTSHVRK